MSTRIRIWFLVVAALFAFTGSACAVTLICYCRPNGDLPPDASLATLQDTLNATWTIVASPGAADGTYTITTDTGSTFGVNVTNGVASHYGSSDGGHNYGDISYTYSVGFGAQGVYYSMQGGATGQSGGLVSYTDIHGTVHAQDSEVTCTASIKNQQDGDTANAIVSNFNFPITSDAVPTPSPTPSVTPTPTPTPGNTGPGASPSPSASPGSGSPGSSPGSSPGDGSGGSGGSGSPSGSPGSSPSGSPGSSPGASPGGSGTPAATATPAGGTPGGDSPGTGQFPTAATPGITPPDGAYGSRSGDATKGQIDTVKGISDKGSAMYDTLAPVVDDFANAKVPAMKSPTTAMINQLNIDMGKLGTAHVSWAWAQDTITALRSITLFFLLLWFYVKSYKLVADMVSALGGVMGGGSGGGKDD